METRGILKIIFLFLCLSSHAFAAEKILPVSTEKSTLMWIGEKLTGSHTGSIKLKSGSVKTHDGVLKGGEFEVDMTSIQVVDIKDPEKNLKLTNHLKSDDFFNAEKFPTAKFVITKVQSIKAKGEEPNTKIRGKLTIKGITMPLTFDVVVNITKENATATAKVVVDRTLYNVRYGSGKFFDNLGDKIIYDEFKLAMNLTT